MFRTILVPVDLEHLDRLDKALSVAAALADQFDARVRYLGVAPETPGPLGRNPAEFAAKLTAFAADQAKTRGIRADAHPVAAHDVAAELNEALLTAAKEDEADLIVIGSHVPGWLDRLWPSHGGSVAARASCSVFVVR